MANQDLLERTYHFALNVIKIVRALPNVAEAWNVKNQLSRCGPSVAANYRAARRSRSRKEFLARLGVVEEEADECTFWLKFVIDTCMLPLPQVQPVLNEADELLRIIVKSRKTTREGGLG